MASPAGITDLIGGIPDAVLSLYRGMKELAIEVSSDARQIIGISKAKLRRRKMTKAINDAIMVEKSQNGVEQLRCMYDVGLPYNLIRVPGDRFVDEIVEINFYCDESIRSRSVMVHLQFPSEYKTPETYYHCVSGLIEAQVDRYDILTQINFGFGYTSFEMGTADTGAQFDIYDPTGVYYVVLTEEAKDKLGSTPTSNLGENVIFTEKPEAVLISNSLEIIYYNSGRHFAFKPLDAPPGTWFFKAMEVKDVRGIDKAELLSGFITLMKLGEGCPYAAVERYKRLCALENMFFLNRRQADGGGVRSDKLELIELSKSLRRRIRGNDNTDSSDARKEAQYKGMQFGFGEICGYRPPRDQTQSLNLVSNAIALEIGDTDSLLSASAIRARMWSGRRDGIPGLARTLSKRKSCVSGNDEFTIIYRPDSGGYIGHISSENADLRTYCSLENNFDSYVARNLCILDITGASEEVFRSGKILKEMKEDIALYLRSEVSLLADIKSAMAIKKTIAVSEVESWANRIGMSRESGEKLTREVFAYFSWVGLPVTPSTADRSCLYRVMRSEHGTSVWRGCSVEFDRGLSLRGCLLSTSNGYGHVISMEREVGYKIMDSNGDAIVPQKTVSTIRNNGMASKTVYPEGKVVHLDPDHYDDVEVTTDREGRKILEKDRSSRDVFIEDIKAEGLGIRESLVLISMLQKGESEELFPEVEVYILRKPKNRLEHYLSAIISAQVAGGQLPSRTRLRKRIIITAIYEWIKRVGDRMEILYEQHVEQNPATESITRVLERESQWYDRGESVEKNFDSCRDNSKTEGRRSTDIMVNEHEGRNNSNETKRVHSRSNICSNVKPLVTTERICYEKRRARVHIIKYRRHLRRVSNARNAGSLKEKNKGVFKSNSLSKTRNIDTINSDDAKRRCSKRVGRDISKKPSVKARKWKRDPKYSICKQDLCSKGHSIRYKDIENITYRSSSEVTRSYTAKGNRGLLLFKSEVMRLYSESDGLRRIMRASTNGVRMICKNNLKSKYKHLEDIPKDVTVYKRMEMPVDRGKWKNENIFHKKRQKQTKENN